jgi:hypothetical protein
MGGGGKRGRGQALKVLEEEEAVLLERFALFLYK